MANVQRSAEAQADILLALKEGLAAVSAGGLAIESIDTRADLLESGYVDSLSVADFLVGVENLYGVSVAPWEVGGRLNTLEALADYIAASGRQRL